MGGCLVLEQNRIYRLSDEIMRLLNATELLEDMALNLHLLNQENATQKIVDDIEKTLIAQGEKLKLGF